MDDLKYIQLQDDLKNELKNGGFKSGDRFYSDKELMAKYRCSYATVSHALKDMVEAGYFIRKRGLGTFVKESGKVPGMAGDIMTKELLINGLSPEEHRRQSPTSWFVVEEIRKGIINNYPGPIRIERFEDIQRKLEMKEDILAILLSPPKDFVKSFSENLPGCVIVNHKRDFRMEFDSVSWEMISGVYEAAAYLIRELGHKKIAFIGGDREEFHADRFAGYRLALEAHNIPFDEKYSIRGFHEGSVKEGRKAMEEFLELPERPTAVFADTDIKALGAIEAINAAGLKVPEDISVAGFDDIPGADSFSPPLTTVRIPYCEIGKAAVDMLMEKLRTGNGVRSKILMSELVVRKSCAENKDGRLQ